MNVAGPYTPRDFITEAAEELGIIDPGGVVEAEDVNSIFFSLNLMLSKWSTKGLTSRAYFTESFPLQAGKRQYTWGLVGTPDFNSQRPTKIITADLQYVNQGNLIVPMEVAGNNQYQAYGDRLIVTGPSRIVYPDMQEPNAVINFYPIPDQAYNVIFTSEKAFLGLNNLDVVFTIDAIYFEPIVTNLAIRVAPKFGKTPSQDLRDMARSSMADLINITKPEMFASSDFPARKMGTNAPILDGGYQ
jgi:hypothetical protein